MLTSNYVGADPTTDESDMEEAGDEDVIRKVQGDLGSLATDQEIRTKLKECYGKALDELAA